MKSRHRYILASCFLALGLALNFSSLFSQQTAGELFEKALYVEEAQGDLEKAIGLYQQILKKFSENREVCAKAQLKIGQCYEKLGNTEAVKAYELVLKNLGDRPDEVAIARERLAVLRQEAPPGAAVVNLPMGDARMSVEAVSPDGTKLLGISEDGPDVVVYDTVAGRMDFITKFDQDREPLWAGVPVWSPDGTEIAYTVALDSINKKYEIRVSDLHGNSRRLWRTEGAYVWPMDWLPDAKAILVVEQHPDKSSSLGTLPAEGGPFKSLGPVEGFAGQARISPDGRFIAYLEGQSPPYNIRIMSLDSKLTHVLTDHPANDGHPLWSPDGKYVVFTSNRQGFRGLWGQAMKDGQPEGDPFLIEELVESIDLLNWTPAGLAMTKSFDIEDIFIQSVDPGTLEPLGKPRLLVYGSTGNNSSLRWSPDGKWMAFVSMDNGPGQVRVVVRPSAGGVDREFKAPVIWWEPYMATLAWHPECRSVGFAVFANNTEYKQATLQLLDIDTGEWKRQMVPDIPYAYFYMEWSGDGKSVFYVNNGARTDSGIIERNLETAAERYIYKPAKSYICWFSGLRLSQDRKRLVFHQMDVVEPGSEVQSQILSLDLDTGLSRTIYSGKEPVADPVWSPDGRNILVLTDPPEGGVPEMGKFLGILPAAGGPLKILKIDMNWPEGPRFRHGFIAPDWAPDGKEISFTARSMREEVFLMKNVIPKDRR